MISQNLTNLSLELEKIATLYVSNRLDSEDLESPKKYLQISDLLNEWQRKTRVLFLISILNKVCIEEDKFYEFTEPYQAAMKYTAVIKKNNYFYLLDEDGDLREIFDSEKFAQFIDDNYCEVYDPE